MLKPESTKTFDVEVEMVKISLCICTMNRPGDLLNCLKSVFQSIELPDEVIVSDDSPDGQPTKAVAGQFPAVVYQEGPHRGLGPNRNACIQSAKGTHIIFIDDDVCVPPDFFALARQSIAESGPLTIITGYEMKYEQGIARKIVPHNADFWGLQRLPVNETYRAIVINSTIFPRSVFRQALFDENLRYGSEEIDMAHHATALGYQIAYQGNLFVHHYPSSINREHYKRFVHASRLYATTKSYWRYDRSLPKTIAYVLLAPIQLIGSAVKGGDVREVWGALKSISIAGQYLMKSLKS